MRRIIVFAVFCVAFTASISQAQTINTSASSSHTATGRAIGLMLAAVDKSIIKQFSKAWRQSGQGRRMDEAVVLILRNADGSYEAVSGGNTNEAYRFTFTWNPAIVAIVHTHPTSRDPKPTAGDIEVAKRFKVPVFIITFRGMFMYDPAANQMTKVHDGTDWLELPKWSAKSDSTGKQQIAKQ